MGYFLQLLFGSLFGKSPKNSVRIDASNVPPRHPAKAYRKAAFSQVEILERIDDLPTAQVLHVIDGDSVVVDLFRDVNEIRLDSIDCPEGDQPWGNTAAAGLIKMIGGKPVRLEQHGQDPYGRTLATIYLWDGRAKDWLNVNERMVMLGHAWVMRQYYDHLPPDRKFKLNRLERWAKSKNIGLWSEPNPIPPWKWRNVSRESPRSKNRFA